ncbi:MAG: hypothetical protein QOE77_199 [Blastocatellia bacterium]|nr:hypothetical protein [Blastocatellia bacterium]
MESRARIGGHPIHPMLVPFPIALWTTSFVADVIFYFQRNSSFLFVAKFLLAAGILGALGAAVVGFIDWMAIKDQGAKKVANWHARLNMLALILFLLSFFFRLGRYGGLVGHHLTIPFCLSAAGVILISISGYLGGELAYRYGIGLSLKAGAPVE